MSQSWGTLSSNQCPDWDALKDAIDTGVLPSGGTAITGTTQSIYKTIGGALVAVVVAVVCVDVLVVVVVVVLAVVAKVAV